MKKTSLRESFEPIDNLSVSSRYSVEEGGSVSGTISVSTIRSSVAIGCDGGTSAVVRITDIARVSGHVAAERGTVEEGVLVLVHAVLLLLVLLVTIDVGAVIRAAIGIEVVAGKVVVIITFGLVVLVSPVVRVGTIAVWVSIAVVVADEVVVLLTFGLVVLVAPVVWVGTVGVRVAIAVVTIAVVATDKVVVVLVLSNFHAEAHLHLHLVVLRLLVVLVVVVVDTGGSVVRAMGKVWVSVVVGIVFLLLVLRNLDTIGLLSLLLGGILLLISLLGLLLLGSILLLRLGNRVEKLVGTIVRIGVVVDRSIEVTVGREAEAWVVRGIWVRGIIWVRTISEATISVVWSIWVTELLVDLLMDTGVAVQWSAIRVGSIDVRGTVAISASDEAILLLFSADKSDDKGGNVRSHPKDWFGLLLKK